MNLYGPHGFKPDISLGNRIYVIYFNTDKAGAGYINNNNIGWLVASKICSYRDNKIVNGAMSTDIGYIDQPRPGSAAVYDAKSRRYVVKLVLDETYEAWRKSGPFCIYYHSPKQWFSGELYSNMMHFK